MPASPTVSTQEIVNALLTWRGDISAAARALGMARNSLYERMKRLGLDPGKFRSQGGANPVTPITMVSGMPGMPGFNGRAKDAQEKRRAIYPSGGDRGRLGGVQQGTATADPEVVPIKTAPKRQEPIRLKPELRDRLQRAVWQLQARFQEPTNENLILEQLVEETLDRWLASKLEPTPAARPRGKKAAGEKGGDE
jgi:hypothetical protein